MAVTAPTKASIVADLEAIIMGLTNDLVEREAAVAEVRAEMDEISGALKALTGHKARVRKATKAKAPKAVEPTPPAIVGTTAREVTLSILESENRVWAPSEVFMTAGTRLHTSQAVSNVLPGLVKEGLVVKEAPGQYRAMKHLVDVGSVEAGANAGNGVNA